MAETSLSYFSNIFRPSRPRYESLSCLPLHRTLTTSIPLYHRPRNRAQPLSSETEPACHSYCSLGCMVEIESHMDFNSSSPFPEGVISFLDTDLYKLTMQCAVFKYFKDVPVTYAFTNRTPEKRLSRAGYRWLHEQITSRYHCPLPKLQLRAPC